MASNVGRSLGAVHFIRPQGLRASTAISEMRLSKKTRLADLIALRKFEYGYRSGSVLYSCIAFWQLASHQELDLGLGRDGLDHLVHAVSETPENTSDIRCTSCDDSRGRLP